MALPALLARAGPALLRTGGQGGAQTLNILSTIKSTLPVIEEEADVTVIGGHDAKKSQLYLVAMAVAWSMVTRRNVNKLLPPPGTILVEYPLEENSVRVLIRLKSSYLDALVASVANPAARKFVLFSGPPDGPYKGGAWQFSNALPGLPNGPANKRTGWESETILTHEPTYVDRAGLTRKTQAPAPPGDGVSRGTAAVATSTVGGRFAYDPTYLLYSALSIPCSTAGMLRDNSAAAYPPPNAPPNPPAGATTNAPLPKAIQ